MLFTSEKGPSFTDSPFCLSPQEVSNCFDRIVEQHARTNPAHHVANLLAHRRLVAMDGAPLAGGLLCAKLASLQPRVAVSHQLLILGRGRFYPQPLLAVDLDHATHNPLFVFNTIHPFLAINHKLVSLGARTALAVTEGVP